MGLLWETQEAFRQLMRGFREYAFVAVVSIFSVENIKVLLSLFRPLCFVAEYLR